MWFYTGRVPSPRGVQTRQAGCAQWPPACTDQNNLWGSRRVVMLLLRIVSRMWRRVKVAFLPQWFRVDEGMHEGGCKCFPKGESMKSCGQWASPLRDPWPRPFYQGDGDGGFR
jgi:hypothetical protein